jgi:AcrR family transcriptional regulator
VTATAPTRSSTRKQLLTDLRRREILAAAVRVFGKKGFTAACVGDVAEAAKIAKGTVYLYFESKEEIYATAVQMAIAQLQALAAERTRSAKNARDRLAIAISVRMEFWHEQLSLYRLLLTVGRESQHKRQTNEVLRSGHAYFLGLLEEGAAAGEFPETLTPESLDSLAWMILDLIRGANERRLDRLTKSTPQQDAAAITRIAFRNLGLSTAD